MPSDAPKNFRRCLCEYEFDEPHAPADRGRQVVCAKCWPHDADARGWKARAEKAEAEVARLTQDLDSIKAAISEAKR